MDIFTPPQSQQFIHNGMETVGQKDGLRALHYNRKEVGPFNLEEEFEPRSLPRWTRRIPLNTNKYISNKIFPDSLHNSWTYKIFQDKLHNSWTNKIFQDKLHNSWTYKTFQDKLHNSWTYKTFQDKLHNSWTYKIFQQTQDHGT